MNHSAFARRLQELGDCLGLLQNCCSIAGWLQPLEGYLLYMLAAEGPGVGAVVEVGSYLGRSTAFLASGAKNARREPVTAVDHFRGSPEHQAGQAIESKPLQEDGTTFLRFQDNLQRLGLADYVQPIVASSREAAGAWSKPIRLLFIDAEHSYEAARLDFEAWSPFVVDGGIICFHDVGTWPGVTRFYQELMQSAAPFKERLAVQSLRAIQRLSPQT